MATMPPQNAFNTELVSVAADASALASFLVGRINAKFGEALAGRGAQLVIPVDQPTVVRLPARAAPAAAPGADLDLAPVAHMLTALRDDDTQPLAVLALEHTADRLVQYLMETVPAPKAIAGVHNARAIPQPAPRTARQTVDDLNVQYRALAAFLGVSAAAAQA